MGFLWHFFIFPGIFYQGALLPSENFVGKLMGPQKKVVTVTNLFSIHNSNVLFLLFRLHKLENGCSKRKNVCLFVSKRKELTGLARVTTLQCKNVNKFGI